MKAELDGIPVEYEYDPESGEVSAFNDDLRILAIGSTQHEAEQRFLEALARLSRGAADAMNERLG